MNVVVKATVSYEYIVDVPTTLVKSDNPVPLMLACLQAQDAEYDFSKTKTRIEYVYDAKTGEVILG